MIFRLPTSLKRCSDGELMQRVSRDDSRAFEELYHRYARRLLHFFRRMLGGDKETAADFLQDTFLRVWSARRTFRGYDAETWIFTLAYNLIRNEFRHREVHDAYVWQASDEDEAADSLAELRIDAAILVRVGERKSIQQTTLYYEQFMAYVSRSNRLFSAPTIRTADLQNEFLWLLDEGHCFRDQLVKFCRLKSAQESKEHYTLGSIETFMRMVESGQGITFIPELAIDQLTPTQRELVRPFALPIPTREVVLATSQEFIRLAVSNLIQKAIIASVPTKNLTLQPMQQRL